MRLIPLLLLAYAAAGPVHGDRDPPLRYVTTVAASTGEVWNALTTEIGAEAWLAPEVSIDLRPGGRVAFADRSDEHFDHGLSTSATILGLEPGRMLSLAWVSPSAGASIRDHRTVVVIRLRALDASRTRVSVRHTGWGDGEAWASARERVDDAWRAALSRLVRALELEPFDRKDDAEAEQSVRRDRVVALHAPVEPAPRIRDQDASLNHLVDPAGYETGRLGSLGRVRRAGNGPRTMILVAGLGFGGELFDGLMEGREEAFTMYAVTLPGFSGTAAPPSPPPGTSFGEQTWTRAAADAVSRLLVETGAERAVLVGHWLGGTQVALRTAIDHPDRVGSVVLLSGSARWVPPEPDPDVPDDRPLEDRVAGIDGFAESWFKTVTRETWDDNNFLPRDYAVNPILGLRLWRQAARPPLHVWVRYLCEFLAQDLTLELDRLQVPTLLLLPGLEGHFHEPGNDYLRAYTHWSWGDAALRNARIVTRTVPRSRVVMWVDRPAVVRAHVDAFLAEAAAGTRLRAWRERATGFEPATSSLEGRSASTICAGLRAGGYSRGLPVACGGAVSAHPP